MWLFEVGVASHSRMKVILLICLSSPFLGLHSEEKVLGPPTLKVKATAKGQFVRYGQQFSTFSAECEEVRDVKGSFTNMKTSIDQNSIRESVKLISFYVVSAQYRD